MTQLTLPTTEVELQQQLAQYKVSGEYLSNKRVRSETIDNGLFSL